MAPSNGSTHVCRCNDGWRLDPAAEYKSVPVCNVQDPVLKSWRTALIATASVLGVLLLVVILIAIIFARKAK